MATLKPNPYWLAEELQHIRDLRKNQRVIKTRWYVEEYTPGYNTGGYYDMDIPAEFKVVSPYYETEQDAQDWMDRPDPEEGSTLKVKRQTLYEWEETCREWENDS